MCRALRSRASNRHSKLCALMVTVVWRRVSLFVVPICGFPKSERSRLGGVSYKQNHRVSQGSK